MKKVVGLLVLLVFVQQLATAQKNEITWYSFEEAIQKTAEKPKMVLVDVYTDWCGWCKKMDRNTFTDSKVIEYVNENFYAVKLNAEDRKRKFEFKGKEYTEQMMAYNMRVRSYPNFVVMDAAMENITQLPGYREPDNFISSLKILLENFDH
jgi:thioredoxin-related protein|tara:strand:- start:87 stop:539 length:453 start_codon:yes stop_codon:yes gene_type:complete